MPGQGRLLGAWLLLVLGAFLPWVDHAVLGAVPGYQAVGFWTFYASMLALAGGIVPRRTLAAVQGALVGVAALGFAGWYLVHTATTWGMSGGWMPGPGVVLTLGGGGLALAAAIQLWSGRHAVPADGAQPA